MMEMTSAPMIAAVNVATENPVMICATNQKNIPLITTENNPSVRILIGSVSSVTTGFTTILRNTRQAATMSAVTMELILIPATKCGSANTASVVMIQRSKIIDRVYYTKSSSTTLFTTAPSAVPPVSFMTAPTSMPSLDLSSIPRSAFLVLAMTRISSSPIIAG